MSTRKKIVAGNWKMNKTFSEGTALAEEITGKLEAGDVTVILGTPYIHLQAVGAIIKDHPNLFLAAQNCHQAAGGAYTGEISPAMLQSLGVQYVILGHSERRKYFGETDASVSEKVSIALAHDLLPIVCVGEELSVREAGKHEALVGEQIENALFDLSPEDFGKIVIAYEPVWAIGTGLTASPDQAQEMHGFIRNTLAAKYGDEIAQATTILYGGSCKPANAQSLFSQPDVDGGLIGGASLKADDFIAITNSY